MGCNEFHQKSPQQRLSFSLSQHPAVHQRQSTSNNQKDGAIVLPSAAAVALEMTGDKFRSYRGHICGPAAPSRYKISANTPRIPPTNKLTQKSSTTLRCQQFGESSKLFPWWQRNKAFVNKKKYPSPSKSNTKHMHGQKNKRSSDHPSIGNQEE